MSKPKKPMIPQSRDFLNRLKMECAEELGRVQFTKEFNDHYKGDLPSRQNGEEGGPIGGLMVKKMIEYAKNH